MKIALMGDIAMFGRYCFNKNNKLLNYFDEVKEYLSEFDLIVGNLEAPFVVDEMPIGGKSATISSHPKNIELIKHIGYTHLNLSNNHIGDYGKSGYERTKKLINDYDIDWFGTEEKQIKININGEKICLLGFCSYNTNPSPLGNKINKGLNYLDVENVYNSMSKNHEEGFFNVLSIHSGQEHVHMPSYDDIRFARLLANKFNYVYYGHHPHVIQGFEHINKSAIFYSLGNFIFDDVYSARDNKRPLIKLSEANKTGLIGEIEITNGAISKVTSTEVYMGKNNMHIRNSISNDERNIYDHYLCDAGSSEYNKIRSSYILNYINTRKEMRNFKWFVNRLNLNSVGILLKSKINSILYKKHFASKINYLEENK